MTDFKYSLSNLKPVESSKVALTFPDGATREFPKDTTGLDIAKGISPSLAKRTVAMALDGVVTDLADPIWLDLPGEFTTTNNTGLILDVGAVTNVTRFYRLVALP